MTNRKQAHAPEAMLVDSEAAAEEEGQVAAHTQAVARIYGRTGRRPTGFAGRRRRAYG